MEPADEIVVDRRPDGRLAIFVTHEFYPNQTEIRVGMWKGRRVAIKTGRYLQAEIEIHRQIPPHPHIVSFYEALPDATGFVMQGIKGGLKLTDYLNAQRSPLKIECCQELICQLASALEHLHAHDIIHHDLKPENVLIEEEGNIYLCDFGVSEKGEGKPENRTFGTRHYRSPEQAEESRLPITTKIDVYAFGYICRYIIYSGHDSKSSYSISRELISLIDSCLSEKAEDRPTMTEFIRQLMLINMNKTVSEDIDNLLKMKAQLKEVIGVYQKNGIDLPDEIKICIKKVDELTSILNLD